MSNRQGVTLLEATIAMTIVGLIAVATLGEFATELRVGAKAAGALGLEALARDRVAALQITPTEMLAHLPDSLSKGTFPSPFSDHDWTVDLKTDRNTVGLIDVQVHVRSPRGQFRVATRFFRPPSQVDRSRP
jgi:hypothetical protein